MRISNLILASIAFGAITVDALAERVPCPVVVDRETGKFTSSRAKYRCFDDSRSAKRSGFTKHSFSDDDSCSGGGGGTSSLTGPGERRSNVFSAPAGGTIDYSFPGGGEFEIKVFNANTERRVEQVLETSAAGSGSVNFSAQSFPVYVKVEGPGAWTATVQLP